MRAEAETSNVRARGRRETDDARQYAVQKFATDIVEAAENLKRGIDALPPASPGEPEILVKVREGLAGIERSFTGVLERNGIKKDDPVGQPFDPNMHQAMAEQDSEVHPPGTVMQAWTACWTLNGRLLKPAMVVVAKSPTRRTARVRGQNQHDRLNRTRAAEQRRRRMNVLSQNSAIRSCPRRSGPIHLRHIHP